MTKEDFLTQIEKYKWDNNGLVSYLKSDEAKFSLSDRDTVLASLSMNEKVFEFASEELKSDKEFVMQVIQTDNRVNFNVPHRLSLNIQFASDELRGDKDIVMAAVSMNGHALQYASQELKADKEVVMAAKEVWAMKYASKELKSDRKFIMQLVIANGDALYHASNNLKADREVVIAAVSNDGLALQYASEELRADKAVVMAAVSNNGRALQYTSEELRADKAVVMAAVSNNGRAFQYASEELRADKEVVTKAIYKHRDALNYASSELKDSLLDRTVKLERHFDDGYGTTFCLSQIHMSLAQFHGFLEGWVDDSFFDINSEDSLIDFLKEEEKLYDDETGKLHYEQWHELMVEIPSTGIDTSGFGDNAGNTVDDLKIFVNNELIVTF